jgi:hypothetical protein
MAPGEALDLHLSELRELVPLPFYALADHPALAYQYISA